jgi:hypothetical protein
MKKTTGFLIMAIAGVPIVVRYKEAAGVLRVLLELYKGFYTDLSWTMLIVLGIGCVMIGWKAKELSTTIKNKRATKEEKTQQ